MRNRIQLVRVAVLAAAFVVCAVRPAHALITAAITPATQTVTPGTDFDVFIDVTAAGANFNGFDFVIEYDPAALTPVPLASLAAQQGCLMTGLCSAACGNTFHRFSANADSIVINDVLLCNGVALTGPGNIYKLRFHASNTPQVTQLTIRSVHFFNAGLLVTPLSTSGAQIGIGVSLGVTPGAIRGVQPVRAEPNPARGRVQFVSHDERAGAAEAAIVDLQGRLVRQIGVVSLGPQARFAWDGLDQHGNRVPAGLYLVQVRRGSDVQTSRFILLQ